jgi:hypothetical protein
MWCDKLTSLEENKLKGKKKPKSRKSKLVDQTCIVDRAGFFIFGGLDANEKVCDDLILFQFDIEANYKIIHQGEYKPDEVGMCHMVASTVVTNGRGPMGRYQHAAAIFNNYYVVYGGRNDNQYSADLKNVAMNDLHLLDLYSNTWLTVAIFGESMITSRWGHSMVASKDKLLILGGMNLN